MDSTDYKKLSAARLVLCPATDVSAGVTSGSMGYLLNTNMRGGVDMARDGEVPELDGDVVESGKFLGALDRAVRSYLDDCVRLLYLKKSSNAFAETGFRFMPQHPYRVVLWTGKTDDGYEFSFMPLRDAGKVSSDTVSPGAYRCTQAV